ncbi:MAG: hypothetical protein ACLTXI_05815 [Collinsella sp.]
MALRDRRIVCGLTCALTVSSLLMPSVSFAAEWVETVGTTYNAGAAAVTAARGLGRCRRYDAQWL